jgi:hypothetical protein
MPFQPGGQSGSRVRIATGLARQLQQKVRVQGPHKRSIQLPRPYSEIGQRCFDVAQAHVARRPAIWTTLNLAAPRLHSR